MTVEEPAQPDLEVGSVSASDTSPETGASFTLSATVTNAGDAESAATTLRYYRSTDATITTSDTQEGTDAVGTLAASGTSPESITLTAPDSAGTYYYGACVDSVTDESDTADNCSSSVTVTVSAATSTLSVEVTAPQEWAPVGGTVTYSAQVVNSEGMEVSGYSFSWTSGDQSKATVDSSGVVTAVEVGETTITATATLSATSLFNPRSTGPALNRPASTAGNSISGSLRMDVVKPVARIEFEPSSLSFTEVGAHQTVTATLYDSDNNENEPHLLGLGLGEW